MLQLPEGSTADAGFALGNSHLAGAYAHHNKECKDKDSKDDNIVSSLDDPVREAVVESLENMGTHLRVESAKAGGWRMGLYNLDGTMDLEMAINDWADPEKVMILNEKLLYMKMEKQKDIERHAMLFKKLKDEKATADFEYDKAKDEYEALQKEYGAKGIDHDFHIYKRVKKGILNGDLKEYLSQTHPHEVIYHPSDFNIVEKSIYKSVQELLELCADDGQVEQTPDPWHKQPEVDVMDAVHDILYKQPSTSYVTVTSNSGPGGAISPKRAGTAPTAAAASTSGPDSGPDNNKSNPTTTNITNNNNKNTGPKLVLGNSGQIGVITVRTGVKVINNRSPVRTNTPSASVNVAPIPTRGVPTPALASTLQKQTFPMALIGPQK